MKISDDNTYNGCTKEERRFKNRYVHFATNEIRYATWTLLNFYMTPIHSIWTVQRRWTSVVMERMLENVFCRRKLSSRMDISSWDAMAWCSRTPAMILRITWYIVERACVTIAARALTHNPQTSGAQNKSGLHGWGEIQRMHRGSVFLFIRVMRCVGFGKSPHIHNKKAGFHDRHTLARVSHTCGVSPLGLFGRSNNSASVSSDITLCAA